MQLPRFKPDTPTEDGCKMAAGRRFLQFRVSRIARFHHVAKHAEQVPSVVYGLRPSSVEELGDVLQFVQAVEWPNKQWKVKSIESIVAATTRKRFEADKVGSLATWLYNIATESGDKSSVWIPASVYEQVILALVCVPELRFLAKKLLHRMAELRMGLSPALETAAGRLYRHQPETLAALLWAFKDRDVKPSLHFYGMALDSAMQTTSAGKSRDHVSRMSELLNSTVADWGKQNTEIYCALLKNARNHSELRMVWEKVKESSVTLDESVSEVLFRALLQKGEQSFNKWNQQVPHRNSIHSAVEVLMEEFLVPKRCVSLRAVSTVLRACHRTGQAQPAVAVFRGLCRHKGTTPDREGMRYLMSTISKQARKTLETYDQLHSLWQDVQDAHNGNAPLWCHVAYTEPIAKVCSQAEFTSTLDSILTLNGQEPQHHKLVLEDYNFLIRSCCTAGDKQSSLSVLNYAIEQGIAPDEQILFSLLLQVRQPADLDWYFESVLQALPLFHVRMLSSLQRALFATLKRVQYHTSIRRNDEDSFYDPISGCKHNYSDIQHAFSSSFVALFKSLKHSKNDIDSCVTTLHQLCCSS